MCVRRLRVMQFDSGRIFRRRLHVHPRRDEGHGAVRFRSELEHPNDQQQDHRQTVHGEAITQVRVEPMTCNNDVNKTKRCTFAKELREHM
ncbi:hypothetical protein C6341_g20085 [Phytophthora cactorum]|nr:hypothetical protein C6341_g20085 [Phytophthora cactorum]